MNEEIYWLWFSKLEKINAGLKLKLLEYFEKPENIWNTTSEELEKIGLNKVQIYNILDTENRQNLDKYITYMCKNQIEMITIKSEKYPKKLKDVYDSPIVIYAKGNSKILKEEGYAVIGCRNATYYGEFVANKLAYDLAKENKIVISGLARGIDTSSHIGCMRAGGKTIAVLGSGIDVIYPHENKNVAEKIVQTGGLLVSEYIVGTKPEALHFPARNRIISALSSGVIVVEAKAKSGSLITVDFALEQGKDVYAVPGNITSANSKRN